MAALARPLLACACATLLTVASGNVLALDVRSLDLLAPAVLPSVAEQPARVQNCTILKIGRREDGFRVVSYDDDVPFFTAKDVPLLLPKVPVFGLLQGAKITACNPTGVPPFLIVNDGANVSGQLHCSFKEKPQRCPLGLNVQIEEYYMRTPLDPTNSTPRSAAL